MQQDDLNKIQQCRGKHNKLGYAYQLIFVKLLNYFPKLTPFELIEEIVIYASVQLSINYQAIYDYQNNIVKISAHRKDITEYLGLSLFDDIAQTKLRKFIFGEALRLEAHSLLKIQAIIFLKTNNILLPASDTLNRLISFERKQARKHIFEVIHSRLTDDIPKKLNDLFVEVDI